MAVKIDSTQPAQLAIINVDALQDESSREAGKLYEAAVKDGMFYVNLDHGTTSIAINALQPQIWDILTEYFSQPISVKEKDVRLDQTADQDKGFKSYGLDETFELPASLQGHGKQLEAFSLLCHETCMRLLRSLAGQLGLKTSRDIMASHCNQSDSGMKLVREPTREKLTDVDDNSHRDSGSISLTFAHTEGLCTKEKERDTWRFVSPKPNTMIVNIGRTLDGMSGSVLHAPVHAVSQSGDGAIQRGFLTYFLRPDYVTGM